MNIKSPFLLSARNKLIIMIALMIVIAVTIIGLFSNNFIVKIIILSIILLIYGIIGGYQSQSQNSKANIWIVIKNIMIKFNLALSISALLVMRYNASQNLNSLSTSYLIFFMSCIPLFALLYIGERLGRMLFLQQYPELAYFTEPPVDESESSAENKQ